MIIAHVVLSFVLSGAAIAILVRGLRFRPSTPIWSLLLVLFFATWAGGLWLLPVGPSHLGINWLPFVLVTILVAVLVVALAPHGGTRKGDEREVEREVEVGLGVFFWVLIGALTVAVVSGYQ